MVHGFPIELTSNVQTGTEFDVETDDAEAAAGTGDTTGATAGAVAGPHAPAVKVLAPTQLLDRQSLGS